MGDTGPGRVGSRVEPSNSVTQPKAASEVAPMSAVRLKRKDLSLRELKKYCVEAIFP